MTDTSLHSLIDNERDVIDHLDHTIAGLESQVAAIEAKIANYRSLRDNFCSIIELLKSEKPSEVPSGDVDDTEEKKPKSQQFRNLFAFFEGRNNAWADTTEITEGTGLKSHAIRQMLYVRYRSMFDQRDHPDDPRRKQFRMKSAS